MTREMKERRRAYYEAHKAEAKAYQKSYYEAHKDEMKAYYQAHREDKKAYYQAHREDKKAYYQAHREDRKAYMKSDTNSHGRPKNYIRQQSNYYLFNVLKHTKLNGYEIHHCFGYDDYRNFIYIPKALHLQIHQYLRDNNIDADTDHYSKIAHLVVAWDGYVYIKD